MTDLTKKTVEELCTIVWTCGGSKAAAYELARRLEAVTKERNKNDNRIDALDDEVTVLQERLFEAQQKNVAQQSEIARLRVALKIAARDFENMKNFCSLDYLMKATASARNSLKINTELDELAAHDAEVAAKALEEAADCMDTTPEFYQGFCKSDAINELKKMAAEYRAKATL